MRTIVEAVDLVVGEPPSDPVSICLHDREIVAMLFPVGRCRGPLVRALAGVDPPRAGVVHLFDDARVVIANEASPLAAAFDLQPDLVLVDGLVDHLGPHAEREAWVRMASERERGASVLLATASADVAYRCDRVSLAMWEKDELFREIDSVRHRMHGLVRDVLETADERKAPGAYLAREIRRLSMAARALLAELRRFMSSREDLVQMHTAAVDVASELVSDHVLDALIADGDER